MKQINDLKDFVELLCGTFDNKKQIEELKNQGVTDFPSARHVNQTLNNRITGIPENFDGYFVLEESYYTTNDKTNSMSHLFLFTKEGENFKLTSYEIPEGFSQGNFIYENIKSSIEYKKLKVHDKFTPMIYHYQNGVYHGESVSMFSPVLRFTLIEDLSDEVMSVKETFEVNGKKTFGFDYPIHYIRSTF